MTARVAYGRLAEAAAAPPTGERVAEVARLRNLVIEQILSGEQDGAAAYLQEQDEWVVLLTGSARLEVEGAAHDLRPGDWVLLPAGTPHRLLRTERATTWLAVHLHPA